VSIATEGKVMRKRAWVTLAFCFLAALSQAGRVSVQDSLAIHLRRAHECVTSGLLAEAEAQANLVLLSRTVRVRVDWSAVPTSRKATCEKILVECLNTWTKALDGEVRFEVGDDPAAEVAVSFSDSVQLKGKEVGGMVTWRRSVLSYSANRADYQLSAEVVLRLNDLRHKPLADAAMAQATIHEFGHILGLADSSLKAGVMSRLDLARPITAPSVDEINALQELRGEAMDLRNSATMYLGTGELFPDLS